MRFTDAWRPDKNYVGCVFNIFQSVKISYKFLIQFRLKCKIVSLNCFYTVRNLFLFERAVQVQMSKKMYDNVNPLSIYDATKDNMEWVDKHQQSLETILNTEDSTKTICNNLSAYIKKMKDLKS